MNDTKKKRRKFYRKPATPEGIAKAAEDEVRHQRNIKRRAEMREELRQYCDENGYLVKPLPDELFREANRVNLLKPFDLGCADPRGFLRWWFVRLYDGNGYVPPNFELYGWGYTPPAG